MTSLSLSVLWGTVHRASWLPCGQVPLLSQVPHPVNYKIILRKAQKVDEKLLQLSNSGSFYAFYKLNFPLRKPWAVFTNIGIEVS